MEAQDSPRLLPNHTYDKCDAFNFAVWGIAGTALCLFGIVGNSLSIYAFCRHNISPTTFLLVTRAVFDLILLLSVLVTDAVAYVCTFAPVCTNVWLLWPYIRYIWMLTPICHMCGIWLVVLISGNRYWAVCRPHDAMRVWSIQRTRIYVFVTITTMIIFNVPRFFEYRVVAATNNTEFAYEEQGTEFGSSYSYTTIYKVALVNIILIIIPLIFLTLVAAFIIRALQKSVESLKTANQRLTVRDTTQPSQMMRRQEKRKNNVTVMLVTVVITTVVCQMPLAIFHFERYSHVNDCDHALFYLEAMSKFLVNINCCANFIIYTVISSQFRSVLLSALKCGKDGSEMSAIEKETIKLTNI